MGLPFITVGLEKLSQADTERVVKLQRKIEPRFSSFDETKLEAGKRDRCMQEMFLCDNKIAMDKLPLNDYARAWKKIVVKKDARARDDSVALTGFLKKKHLLSCSCKEANPKERGIKNLGFV